MEITDLFLPRNHVLNMFKMFVHHPGSFPSLGDMSGITIYSMLKKYIWNNGKSRPPQLSNKLIIRKK
jgi:hypothetical protein